jgi:hypothetical protein
MENGSMTTVPSEPATEAGRRLLAFARSYDEDDHPHASGELKDHLRADILAIEAEARADVLARVEALEYGYIEKGDGFEPAVSLAALRAILAERQP